MTCARHFLNILNIRKPLLCSQFFAYHKRIATRDPVSSFYLFIYLTYCMRPARPSHAVERCQIKFIPLVVDKWAKNTNHSPPYPRSVPHVFSRLYKYEICAMLLLLLFLWPHFYFKRFSLSFSQPPPLAIYDTTTLSSGHLFSGSSMCTAEYKAI